MKIQSINVISPVGRKKLIQSNKFERHNDLAAKTDNSQISFLGKKDYHNNYSYLNDLRYNSLNKVKSPFQVSQPSTSNQTLVKNFDKLQDGRYLSSDLSTIARKTHLSFLDKAYSPAEKKAFVDYYKKITGFPNLELVSENIKKEFVRAVNATSEQMKKESKWILFCFTLAFP